MRQVVSGLDRWARRGGAVLPLPHGARLGLLVHPASIDRRGRHAVELLRDSAGCRLERLFAPEHGLWGREQDMEQVRGSIDPQSGLPVVSLYGESAESLKPDPAHLQGLDTLVIDLQDVGSRYYTFVYTLSFVMEAARDADVPVVVLDRPNPIGGHRIEGPVLHPCMSSFVGRYSLPVRHGMTIAELARLFNEHFGIGCNLRVVEMEGWRRRMEFEETLLPWVPPSPNMPTPTTARVYPGGCLVEGTNLSEGRGTTKPFELVGAPWIDGHALCERLRADAPPGAVFRAASFQPRFQKHAGRECGGAHVIPADGERFRPFATFLVLLREARALSGAAFHWRTEPYEFEAERPAIDLLLGRDDLRPLIEAIAPLETMERLWKDELAEFADLRRRFLLYD